MDACHYVFQFWENGAAPSDDRLIYKVIGKDIDDALLRLRSLLKTKKVPKKLTVRITYETMAID